MVYLLKRCRHGEQFSNKEQIADTADFIKSIMGKNLPSPFAAGKSSVTPFPKGTLDRPLLMRTYMPVLDLSDEVFGHHDKGKAVHKYTHKSGKENPDKLDKPIHGIVGAIAVNFGEELSYCFDSTECRLLYTWKGGFMDMTNYWGKGTAGSSRKRFGYIGKVLAMSVTRQKAKHQLPVHHNLKATVNSNNVPEFMYSIGDVNFTLKVSPGKSR